MHAYDTYTGVLLDRLVEWLGALHCTVVLLSATLPPTRRSDLVNAYARGAQLPRTVVSGPASYPRITVVSRDVARCVEVVDDRPSRAVTIVPSVGVDDPQVVASFVLEEVRDGGCVAIVCSTVAVAQRRFRSIRELLPADVDLVLLHARMRALERDPVQHGLLAALGPETTPASRPRKLVVVATQVIEQSLDLDLDLVLSDLAPIDLLVQRAGRVHRHEGRERPARHRTPRLGVLDTDGAGIERPLPAGAGAVYASALLMRTRIVLRDRDVLREPEDLDGLIGQVYEEAVPLGTTDDEQPTVLRADSAARNEARRLGGWARDGSVRGPSDEDPPWEAQTSVLMDADELTATGRNSAATRWSERPSLSMVVLRPDELPASRRRPSGAEAVELLRRSVSISHEQVVRPALGAIDALRPTAWRRSGRLRHQLLVELDERGAALPVTTNDGAQVQLPIALDEVEGVIVGGAGDVRSR